MEWLVYPTRTWFVSSHLGSLTSTGVKDSYTWLSIGLRWERPIVFEIGLWSIEPNATTKSVSSGRGRGGGVDLGHPQYSELSLCKLWWQYSPYECFDFCMMFKSQRCRLLLLLLAPTTNKRTLGTSSHSLPIFSRSYPVSLYVNQADFFDANALTHTLIRFFRGEVTYTSERIKIERAHGPFLTFNFRKREGTTHYPKDLPKSIGVTTWPGRGRRIWYIIIYNLFGSIARSLCPKENITFVFLQQSN